MNFCKNKSKKLLALCIILTYMCLATACRSDNNDNLNSGDMAGTESSQETPSPSPSPSAETGINNDTTAPMESTDNIETENGDGLLNNVGDAAQDIVDGVDNAAQDIVGDTNNNTDNNVNSVTEGTR